MKKHHKKVFEENIIKFLVKHNVQPDELRNRYSLTE